MVSSLLAFIALGNPVLPLPVAVSASGAVPVAEAIEAGADVQGKRWVFADEVLAVPTPRAIDAIVFPELAVPLRRSRHMRAGHADARSQTIERNLKLAAADVRAVTGTVSTGKSRLTIATGRDEPARPSADGVAARERGFVRMGSANGGDTLWREDDGLFYITARINGEVVRLIVDTGASYTVLSPEDARRVGVDPRGISFSERADTASGATPMARVVLANLEIGQNVASGVPAMVASGPLRTSLLGQNVLSRLESVTIEGDRMTLR
ncbi:MAG: retropepsin-like aspartic protease family protein [Novosphingobium sp.]